MAIDISSISQQMVTAQTLGNLILAWPQEQIGYQPETPIYGNRATNNEKFLFDYEGAQTISLPSEITDNYVEDNSAVQDHIALAPEIITTNGFIAELNNVVPDELQLIKTAADKLITIDAYAPQLSVSGIRAYNRAFQLYQAALLVRQASVQKWGGLGTKKVNVINPSQDGTDFAQNVDFSSQNKQQVAFQKFYGYRLNRVLFTVQTPWAIFKNCAIQNILVTQAEDSRVVSSFAIEFKPIRYASTKSFNPVIDDYEGRAWYQAAPVEDAGSTSGNFDESPFNIGGA